MNIVDNLYSNFQRRRERELLKAIKNKDIEKISAKWEDVKQLLADRKILLTDIPYGCQSLFEAVEIAFKAGRKEELRNWSKGMQNNLDAMEKYNELMQEGLKRDLHFLDYVAKDCAIYGVYVAVACEHNPKAFKYALDCAELSSIAKAEVKRNPRCIKMIESQELRDQMIAINPEALKFATGHIIRNEEAGVAAVMSDVKNIRRVHPNIFGAVVHRVIAKKQEIIAEIDNIEQLIDKDPSLIKWLPCNAHFATLVCESLGKGETKFFDYIGVTGGWEKVWQSMVLASLLAKQPILIDRISRDVKNRFALVDRLIGGMTDAAVADLAQQSRLIRQITDERVASQVRKAVREAKINEENDQKAELDSEVTQEKST